MEAETLEYRSVFLVKMQLQERVRYVKVNLIKANVNSVIEQFQEESWKKLETADNYKDYIQQLIDLKPNSAVFLRDFHIPEVLAFPPGTELQDHELYLNGSIFFMDKASCFAPLLLSPQQNSHVLDMCAAPGLKTIQLAAYVSSGKVYAVERDKNRYDVLEKMVEQSGANNVTTILQDVTQLEVDQYKHVEYILVDPSCTGSGVRCRQPSANLKARLDEKTRMEKLAGFQITLLRFALTRFPAAKRVVYSTCSLNVEENEKVIEDVLNGLDHNFGVVSVDKKLPGWQNFGSTEFWFGSKCVYCRPEVDHTNGFFITVFERREIQDPVSIFENNKTENKFQGGKKRSYEENLNLYSDGGVKMPKNPKMEYSNVKRIKEDKPFNYLLNSGDTQEVKPSGKKLSVSEKKRSRKKFIKLKKKLLTQKNVGIDTTISLKNHNSSESNKNIKNKKSDQNCDKNNMSHIISETSTKISKAKLRRKRVKLIKLVAESGVNKSEVDKKRKRKQNNMKEIGNKMDDVQIALVKKKEEREVEATEKHKCSKDDKFDGYSPSNNVLLDESSGTNLLSPNTIRVDGIILPLKKKHKKYRLSEYNYTELKINVDENVDEVGSSSKRKNTVKVADCERQKNEDTCPEKQKNSICAVQEQNPINFVSESSKKNAKDDNDKSNKMGKHQKKPKKKHSLDNNNSSSTTNHIEVDTGLEKVYLSEPSNKTTENILNKNNESYKIEKQKKKHNKKHSLDNDSIESIITTNHIQIDRGFEKVCLSDHSNKITEDVCNENNESFKIEKHRKKHKEKHLLDINDSSNTTNHIEADTGVEKVSLSETRNKTTEDISNENNESFKIEKRQKKHKKKLSLDINDSSNTTNHIEADTGLEKVCLSEPSNKTIKNISNENNDSCEKGERRKKHKNKHSLNIDSSNTVNHIEVDTGLEKVSSSEPNNKSTEDVSNGNNESYKIEKHQKKRKKKLSLDINEISNTTNHIEADTGVEKVCLSETRNKTIENISNENNDSCEKGERRKKHKNKHSLNIDSSNTINHIEVDTGLEKVSSSEPNNKSTEDVSNENNESFKIEKHKKKHKKKHSLDVNDSSNTTDHIEADTGVEKVCLLSETRNKTIEDISNENNDSCEKGEHRKKHKNKHSLDIDSSNTINHIEVDTGLEKVCSSEPNNKSTEDVSNKNNESLKIEKKHKKKHKKKHSLDVNDSSNTTNHIQLDNGDLQKDCLSEPSNKSTEDNFQFNFNFKFFIHSEVRCTTFE